MDKKRLFKFKSHHPDNYPPTECKTHHKNHYIIAIYSTLYITYLMYKIQ